MWTQCTQASGWTIQFVSYNNNNNNNNNNESYNLNSKATVGRLANWVKSYSACSKCSDTSLFLIAVRANLKATWTVHELVVSWVTE